MEHRLSAERIVVLRQDIDQLCHDDMTSALHDLDVLEGERDEAYGYASRLFHSMAPQCELLPTLPGLMTQIDNAICGLRAKLAAAQASIAAQVEKVREQKDEICELHRIRGTQGAQIAAMREALRSVWQFVNLGDCPLTTRVVNALNNTAQIAADHNARIRADERKKQDERISIALSYCFELLALKGNSFEINQLAEKIHYALS